MEIHQLVLEVMCVHVLGKRLSEVAPKRRPTIWETYGDPFEEVSQALAQFSEGAASGERGKDH